MCSTVNVISYHYGTHIKARNESYLASHTSLWKPFYLGKQSLTSFHYIRLHNFALFLSIHVMISPLGNRIRGYPTIGRCWQPSPSQCITHGTLQYDAFYTLLRDFWRSNTRRVLYGVKIKTTWYGDRPSVCKPVQATKPCEGFSFSLVQGFFAENCPANVRWITIA